VVIDLWAAVCGFLLFFGIKKFFGLRVEPRVEEEGLDVYEHGEGCYNN
jgi:Amt family ammonium transporter